MTDEQLREAVARAMRDVYLARQPKYSGAGNYPLEEFLHEADAAIALMRPVIRAEALEEAAKVADRAVIPMCETSAERIAAAIRALKEKPNG